METDKIHLIAIVGPTASGKTALSLDIAKKYNGEIIAADSRTIYKDLDIGTAKPSLKERQGIKHYGFDLAGPEQTFSAADFKKFAIETIRAIKSRNKLPIIVGGSGLYIDAVLYDFDFAPANQALRESFSLLDINQLQDLIKQKKLPMPENYKNKRYLLRALERGGAISSKKQLPVDVLVIGINPGREELKKRIVKRAKQMIESGVLSEIKKAYGTYGLNSQAMTGGIYKVFRSYYGGLCDIDSATTEFIKSDLRLAKKQMTWFKRNPDIKWFINQKEALNWLDSQFGGKLK